MKALLAWWERLCSNSKILRFLDYNLRGIGASRTSTVATSMDASGAAAVDAGSALRQASKTRGAASKRRITIATQSCVRRT